MEKSIRKMPLLLVIALLVLISSVTSAQSSSCATGTAVTDPDNNPGLVDDCDVLLAARDTLAGDTTLNWSADLAIGAWDGVTVGGTPLRVRGLNLQEIQLTGTIPSELGNLSNLTSLYLSYNQLTGGIPASLGNLNDLSALNLTSNPLTGPIPVELGSLTNLETLDLSLNPLSGPIPADLGSLTNLKWLDLSVNQLTGCIPAGLQDVPDNTFATLGPPFCSPAEDRAALGALYNATGGASWTNDSGWVTGAPIGQWHGVTTGSGGRVTELRLSQNRLTGPVRAELGSLVNLEELFLSGNRLSGCIPAGLRVVANSDLDQLGLPFCTGAHGAPTISAVTPGMGSLTVAWAAPGRTGGSPIIAYDLRHIDSAATDKSDANWTMVEDIWTTGSGSLNYRITGLTDGTQYDVQVRVVDAASGGPWSATATGTPATW